MVVFINLFQIQMIEWLNCIIKLNKTVRNTSCMSGRTGSALAWHSKDRTFAANWVQQVLWFEARIALYNTWISGGTALCSGGGCN